MILEAVFKLKLGGEIAKISARPYEADPGIVVNGIFQGHIRYRDGQWTSNHSVLSPYANEIINRLNLVKRKFKWGLPDELRAVIYWARYNVDENKVVIGLNDLETNFVHFERDLNEAFQARSIHPDVIIELQYPRTPDSSYMFNKKAP